MPFVQARYRTHTLAFLRATIDARPRDGSSELGTRNSELTHGYPGHPAFAHAGPDPVALHGVSDLLLAVHARADRGAHRGRAHHRGADEAVHRGAPEDGPREPTRAGGVRVRHLGRVPGVQP